MAPHEHNLLPFSTPQSDALLSAERKATDSANNKEKLDVCHDIVWCRTTFAQFTYFCYEWVYCIYGSYTSACFTPLLAQAAHLEADSVGAVPLTYSILEQKNAWL